MSNTQLRRNLLIEERFDLLEAYPQRSWMHQHVEHACAGLFRVSSVITQPSPAPRPVVYYVHRDRQLRASDGFSANAAPRSAPPLPASSTEDFPNRT